MTTDTRMLEQAREIAAEQFASLGTGYGRASAAAIRAGKEDDMLPMKIALAALSTPPVDGEATAADLRAFGASDAACHLYPGSDQVKERAAFCAGAAHSAVDGEAKMREAAQALVDKLKAIHEHPAFVTVFAVTQERLGPYGGPTYHDELAALEGALASTGGGE